MKRILIIVMPVLFIVSCKTTHKLVTNQVKPTTPSLKKENIHTLSAKIRNNQFDFKWLSTHISADVDIDSEHVSFSGNIRLRKDSLIWMSISKLAIKVMQVELTQDSVMTINYHNDNYFKGDYDYINNKIDNDVDFEMMQSILLGNCMEFYSDTSKMKSYFDGKQYIISTIRKRKLKKILYKNKPFHSKDDGQFIFLDPQTFRITHIQVKDFVNARTFDAYYSDFQKVDSIVFPFHIRFEIRASHNINVDLQYKKVMFNQQEEVPFVIPKKYERVQY
jgi:hypothetical protein